MEDLQKTKEELLSELKILRNEVVEAKRLKNKFRESEEKYRVLFESSTDAIMLFDKEGFVDCNAQTLKLFGLSHMDEFIKLHPSQLSPKKQPDGEDSFTASNKKISDMFKNGYNKFEWIHRRKNAEDFPAEVWLTSVKIDGKVCGQATVRDMTKRKLMENDLSRALINLQAVFNHSFQIIIVATDPNGLITVFNVGAERALGYSAEEMVGKQTPGTFHIESELIARGKELSAEFGRPIEGFEVFKVLGSLSKYRELEWTYVRKNGTHLTANLIVTTTKDHKGKITGLVGFAQDITRRKEIEQELIASEEKYRQITEASTEGIYQTDHFGNMLFVNEALTKIFGYEKDKILQKHITSFVAKKDILQATIYFKNIILKGHTIRETLIFKKKDGTHFPGYFSAATYKKRGKVIGITGIITDISKLKELDNSLKKSDVESRSFANLGLLLSAATTWEEIAKIIIATADQLFSFDACFIDSYDLSTNRCSGLLVMDIMNTKRIEISPRAGQFPPTKIMEKILTEGKQLFLRKKFVDTGLIPFGDNARRSASLMYVPIRYKNVVFGILSIQSYTSNFYKEKDLNRLQSLADHCGGAFERIKVLKDLQRAHNQLEQKVEERTDELKSVIEETEKTRDNVDAILKSMSDGLIVTDIHNRVKLMNRVAEDILDVRLSEVLNRPIDFAIKEEYLRERVKETLNKKESGFQFDFKLGGNNQENASIFEARTGLVKDKERKINGIITIFRNVSKEREVERMKTEFISTAAHELRTPLTSIQGFSEILLLRKDISDQEKKKFLGHINKQATNLAQIITDLLDISRIESGKSFALNKEPCFVGDAIKMVAEPFIIESKIHKFEIVTPGKPIEIIVDKDKMAQVLKNLISNAVKYSPDGGKIQIKGGLIKDNYQVSVQDNGLGMTAEQTEKVFDKFYRADATNTAVEGTGLGMSIVKHIVEAHGGKVLVESKIGNGTKVTFTLPLNQGK